MTPAMDSDFRQPVDTIRYAHPTTCEEPEIFHDERQITELVLDGLEEVVSGGIAPLTRCGRQVCVRRA